MSTLPPAKKEISENPASNSLKQPLDPKFVNEDVDRKMRFWGVIQAFREGRYPENKQIDDALKYTLANSPIETSKLSSDGQKLIQDVRELIETARQMVMEKNQNEEFQNFLFATRKADVASNVNVKSPINKGEAQKDGETAGEAFRTLVTLFLRNGELRKLFQDLGFVGRDMFADGAAKAAEVARPDEEKLAQVDQPAPDNEFHDDVPQAFQKKNADKAAAEADKAKQEATSHAQDVANVVDPNASKEQNQAAVADQAKAKAQVLSNKIPQKHKDMAKENFDKSKDYLQEKFPKERRDQFIYRLKKVVVECQRHRDYQDAMDYFLTAFEQYKGHANNLHGQTVSSAAGVRNEGNVATAESAFRTLIERFANGRPTQPILDAIDQIYTDAKNDPELKDWFKRLDTYIRKCLQEPGFIMKDEANTQARQLQESGKKFFVAAEGRDQGKYVPHKDTLFREITHFFKGMGEDPLNKKFGEDWKRLSSDLFLNSEGKPTFKPELWSDIRHILPELLKHVGVIYAPRIEFTNEQVDLLIENLGVTPIQVLPSLAIVEAHNRFKLSAFSNIQDEVQSNFKLTLSGIQFEARDVQFFFRKKTGFPKLKEHGTADVLVGGNGLTVTIEVSGQNAPKGKRSDHVFKVKTVKAKVDKLNFAIRDSKHDTLVKVLRPLATSIIKKQIIKATEQGIREGLQDLDRQLVELRDRAEANKKVEGKGFGDAFKETFQKPKSDKGESKGSFKIATSKRHSLLPDLGHPDSWAKKFDERTGAAKAGSHGKEWYSPAFSIVSENQADPKNTASAKTKGLASAAAVGGGAAVAGGAAAIAGGAGGVSSAAAQGAGQPGETLSAYSTANGATAPGSLVAGTGATAVNGSANGHATETKAAPAIASAIPNANVTTNPPGPTTNPGFA